MGRWWITSQRALIPQVPGQGSLHLNLWQALFVGHSALTTHSGLQSGGAPWYSGKQEQTACPFLSTHLLFGPQGEGLHGLTGVGGISRKHGNVINHKNHWSTTVQIELTGCWLRTTGDECVTNISRETVTGWNVIDDRAGSVRSANARTRIYAFTSNTGFVRRTIRTKDTLRSASFVRVSLVPWNTGTRTGSILLFADSINTAGWRFARIRRFLVCKCELGLKIYNAGSWNTRNRVTYLVVGRTVRKDFQHNRANKNKIQCYL